MARKEKWDKPTSWFVYASIVLVVVIVLYVSYSMYYFNATNQHIEDSRVCDGERCMETVNQHMKLTVELCGKSFELPSNKGGYDASHSHRSGHIHFNAALENMEKTGKFVDSKPLELGEVMNALDIKFNEKCFGEYCTGNTCGKNPATLRLFVNGVENMEFGQYIWHDKDEILITFN